MIKYVGFEFIGRNKVTYEGERAFSKRDNSSIISNIDPLIFVQGKHPSVDYKTHVYQSLMKKPSRTKAKTLSNMLGSTQSSKISLPSFLVNVDIITMVKICCKNNR